MSVIACSGAGAEQLNQFIELIERLEEEKCALMADKKMPKLRQKPPALSQKLCGKL